MTNWNTAANWAPATVPIGIATFGPSSVTTLTFSANASIGSIQFLAGAPIYSFNLGSRRLTIGGNGLSTLIDGTILGAGGRVTKVGAGTLTLTGTNTYTGVTTVSAGVLQVGDGGFTGSIVGNVTNNAIFAINRAGLFTYGGAISGTGSFQQLGPGTTVFTGNNTYAGGTLISAGLLQLGAGGTTGAITGNVINNAAFAINRSNNFTFAGVISGTGTFQQLGAGMTTFTGDSTYTGGTLISAGTLRLGNNGTTGSILGDVINFGTFIINRSNTYTFAGVISGTGAFQKTGSGVTILTGDSTYTGGTTITGGGTLQIGDGGFTGSIVGNVVNNATFAINRADLFTFAGVISGTGQFRQIGTGTTYLSGVSTYTGATFVGAGTLVVDGSIGSSSGLTVATGAMLAGNGIVSSTTINTGGIIAPGLSIGLLTVQGNLVFQTGSAYFAELSPSNADSIVVTGTATLAGNVQAYLQLGNYVPKSYIILSATGGLTGTFDSITTFNLPNYFIASLAYNANDVLLNLSLALGQSPGLNRNQLAVATAIDQAFNAGGGIGGPLTALFNILPSSLPAALTQLSGEVAVGAQQAASFAMNSFLPMLLNPFNDTRVGAIEFGPTVGNSIETWGLAPSTLALGYAPSIQPESHRTDNRLNFWASAFAGFNQVAGDTLIGSHDTAARISGFAVGVDQKISHSMMLGFALAGGGSSWSLTDGLGSGRTDFIQAGLYALTRNGPAYFSAALAYAWHQASTDRTVTITGPDRLAADFNIHGPGLRIEGGYRFATNLFDFTPYVGSQLQAIFIPSYREYATSGSPGFALYYDAKATILARSELGFWLDRTIPLADGTLLALRSRLAWVYDFTNARRITASFQTLPPATFTIDGATSAPNIVLASVVADLKFGNHITLGARFDGELAGKLISYSGTGTLKFKW
ncbi:MAG TPA: autotransporter domain-containing protein [Candidatus Binatia bacterium]